MTRPRTVRRARSLRFAASIRSVFGSGEALLLVLLMWAVVAFALYWIIRLAVRHGIEDARRVTRVDRSAVAVSETIRRQRATYGGDEG